MITIIDYGLGNLGSIVNILKHLRMPCALVSSADGIQSAKALILPGVGRFDRGMEELNSRGLIPALREAVFEMRTPILGICLGMQLLFDQSEEGNCNGLGWIPGQVVRFAPDMVASGRPLKVPHMGWGVVQPTGSTRMFSPWEGESRFYFVHSYCAVPRDTRDVAGTCDYGGPFAAAVERDNVRGVQFHPEKSHRNGMRLLQNVFGGPIGPTPNGSP